MNSIVRQQRTDARARVTALVPTFNNESIIRRCLENVKWADEILIVDSYSTDRTLDICRQYTSCILQHEYINSARQKNWAIPQATYDWILELDTDEQLEQGLQEEIELVLESPPAHIDGYRLRRKNLVYGKWMATCGLYPDYVVRLFRKTCRFENREVHAHLAVPSERIATLQHHIIHHDYTDLYSYMIKFARYISYETDQLVKEGKRFRLWQITLKPMALFCWSYLYKRGYRDGIRGFMLSVFRFYYCFMMYLSLWERKIRKDKTDFV